MGKLGIFLEQGSDLGRRVGLKPSKSWSKEYSEGRIDVPTCEKYNVILRRWDTQNKEHGGCTWRRGSINNANIIHAQVKTRLEKPTLTFLWRVWEDTSWASSGVSPQNCNPSHPSDLDMALQICVGNSDYPHRCLLALSTSRSGTWFLLTLGF